MKKGLTYWRSLISEIINSKRGFYLLSIFILILFVLTLNIAFGLFTSKTMNPAANIKVNNMNYALTINGTAGSLIKASKNDTTEANLIITSLNDIDSKYELIYNVCTDSSCSAYIETPLELKIEFSTKTVDPIIGTIMKSGAKSIRIIITNQTATDLYIQFALNAGYIHNTLEQVRAITTEYNEEDVTIAAYIKGELSTTFPITEEYAATIECSVDNNPTTAIGTASWDGSKWIVDITKITTGRTICNVYFEEDLPTMPTKVVFTVHQDCKATEGYASGSTVNNGTIVGYQYSKDQITWSDTIANLTSVRLNLYATNITAPTGAGSFGNVYIRAVSDKGIYSKTYMWYGQLTVGCGA